MRVDARVRITGYETNVYNGQTGRVVCRSEYGEPFWVVLLDNPNAGPFSRVVVAEAQLAELGE